MAPSLSLAGMGTGPWSMRSRLLAHPLPRRTVGFYHRKLPRHVRWMTFVVGWKRWNASEVLSLVSYQRRAPYPAATQFHRKETVVKSETGEMVYTACDKFSDRFPREGFVIRATPIYGLPLVRVGGVLEPATGKGFLILSMPLTLEAVAGIIRDVRFWQKGM